MACRAIGLAGYSTFMAPPNHAHIHEIYMHPDKVTMSHMDPLDSNDAHWQHGGP